MSEITPYIVYTAYHHEITTVGINENDVVVSLQDLYDAYGITQDDLSWDHIVHTCTNIFPTLKHPNICHDHTTFVSPIYILIFMICRHATLLGESMELMNACHYIVARCLKKEHISCWLLEFELKILEASTVEMKKNTSQFDFQPYFVQWLAAIWECEHDQKSELQRHLEFYHTFKQYCTKAQEECYSALVALKRFQNAEDLLMEEQMAEEKALKKRNKKREKRKQKSRAQIKESNSNIKIENGIAYYNDPNVANHREGCVFQLPSLGQMIDPVSGSIFCKIEFHCTCGVHTKNPYKTDNFL